jgi:hypothetical protein
MECVRAARLRFRVAVYLTEWDRNLMAGIAGFYFADRMLGKRGK